MNKPKPGIGSLIASPLDKKSQSSGQIIAGYWILLQDWTKCSQKCGGGFSYQQRMCVPPKAGGRPCQGSALLKKKCNTHPCPSVNALLTLIEKSKKSTDPATSPKPIVKVGVFSNRPQRYSKCVIKENDAFIMTKVVGSRDPIRKPIRIMMNPMSISIFNDDTYQELFYSFDMHKTKFIVSKTHCCFVLQDNWKKESICGYNEYCGKRKENIWVDGWSNDFKLFNGECRQELKSTKNLNDLLAGKDIEDEISKKSEEIMEEVNLLINLYRQKQQLQHNNQSQ